MKSGWFKKTLSLLLALLCLASTAIACTTEQTPEQPEDPPADQPTEDEKDEEKGEDPVENKIAFTDVDFSDLSNFKEAEGADSGVNGDIYVIHQKVFWKATKNSVLNYDMTKFSVSLQGLLNRQTPTLYVDDGSSAMNWFRFLRSFTDAPLYGMKQNTIDSFDALLDTFAEQIKGFGIVVWDPAVPATSNLATTVCGVDGYLPVMYSEDAASLYQILLSRFGEEIVKMDLCGKFTGEKGSTVWETERESTGSAKCDAYVWALERYLKPGKCDDAHIAYMTDFYPLSIPGGTYLDNSVYETYLPGQDYIVANGIFTLDLSPFGDHPATDDPTQSVGLDYKILREILLCQYEINDGAFSQCIGFPPFPYKYTDQQGGKYDAVMAEWTTVEVMSAYNIAVVADCPGPSSMYNCSVYAQYESQIKYSQKDKRDAALDDLPDYDEDTYYVYIYGGDYDAVSWTYHINANGAWLDEKRGEVPIAWAFNPNLMERVPMLWDVFYHTATDNDYFIAGDSGAGYVNPLLLREGKRKHSDLPDGLEEWAEWCEEWYEAADITITGMILDGNTGYSHDDKRILESYASFSIDGIGVWNWPGNDSGISLVEGTAVSGMAQDSGFTKYSTTDEAAQAIVNIISTGRKLNFYPIKTNIVTPTQICQVIERVQEMLDEEGRGRSIEVVDPYTFFGMLARELDS